MASKMFGIFMVLVLIQAALGKVIDSSKSLKSSEESEEITPKQLLLIYAAVGFFELFKQFSENAANQSRLLLQDESLLANVDDEVVEFKQSLTMFLEKYDARAETEQVWDIMDIYGDTADYYLELPEDELTPASTFIVELLIKYKHKDIQTEFINDFEHFVESFKQMFEEAKSYLGKPELDWYENFQTLTDFEERLEAFGGFIEMA